MRESGQGSNAVLDALSTHLTAPTIELVREAVGGYWVKQDLSLVEDRVYRTLKEALAGKRDYEGVVQAKFDRLLLSLVRFVKLRIDGDGTRFSYLRRMGSASPPREVELQNDLWHFLTTSDYPEAESRHVSAGRVDILIPQGSFRFVIEVKRLLGQWQEAALKPLLQQATAYQQTDVRLGVLAILDLSDRPAGDPHFDKCFEVRERHGEHGDMRNALVIRVPGNRRTPSDHATPGR